MKIIIILAFPLLLFMGCSAPAYVTVSNNQPPQRSNANPEGTETSYQVFYDELGPYGTWIDSPDYGYVWHPNTEPDFRPYATNGHWVYSNEGWTWVSEYNWGWAPFHYGRWFLDNNYGWLWVPGHQWAPAWVTWGSSGNYYGWAPLAPDADAGTWTPPQNTWNFVPAEHVNRVDVSNYVVNNKTTDITNITKNVTIINNVTRVNNTVINNNVTNNTVTNNHVNNTNITNNNVTNNNVANNNRTTNNSVVNNVHVINSTVYNRGPVVNEVESKVNTSITPVSLAPKNQPGKASMNNNTLTVYRPQIRPVPQNNKGAKAAPATVEKYKAKN